MKERRVLGGDSELIRDMLRLVSFPWKMTTIIPLASIILVIRKREQEKFG